MPVAGAQGRPSPAVRATVRCAVCPTQQPRRPCGRVRSWGGARDVRLCPPPSVRVCCPHGCAHGMPRSATPPTARPPHNSRPRKSHSQPPTGQPTPAAPQVSYLAPPRPRRPRTRHPHPSQAACLQDTKRGSERSPKRLLSVGRGVAVTDRLVGRGGWTKRLGQHERSP